MAVNKSFVIKNGLEVSTNLIFADAPKSKIGIGTTNPEYLLHIKGGIGVTDSIVTGVSTIGVLNVGTAGTVITATAAGSVGIGTSNPQHKLQIIGGIGVTDSIVTGVSTVLTTLRVGTGGTVLSVLGAGNSIGVGTASPAYLFHINSPVSTGQTALYVQGDVYITGDLTVDDITFDDATSSNLTVTEALNVTGLSTFAGITTVTGTTLFAKQLNVSGVSTFATEVDFTSGPVIIGSATSTGTASQTLQVTGGAYVSGNTGIGTTNPTVELDVIGDAKVTGVVTATTFIGQVNAGVGTITTLNSTNGTITNISGTAGTITTFNSTDGTITNLTGTAGTITTFNSTDGTITNLTGTSGTITTLNSTNGTINNLTGTSGTITTLNSTNGTITNLTGTSGTITTLNSTNGIITNLTGIAGTITTFNSTDGTITNLTGTSGTITTLNSTNGIITNLTGTSGTITTLNSTNGTINNLTGTSGTITTFNSTNGTITNLTGIAGTITTFNSTDGTITNLTGTAGTITTFNSTDGTITNLTGTAATIGTVKIVSGIITATSGVVTYYGDGQYLNLTSNPSTGIGIGTTGGVVGYGITFLDLKGAGVSTTFYSSSTGIATIFFEGGGSGTINVGIITSFFPGSASSPSMYFVGDTQTGFFSPGAGQFTVVSTGSSVLNVNASGIRVTGIATAIDFDALSDINYKKNVITVNNALSKVDQLRGVSFDWKKTGRSSYGVIAQELEEVLPELVHGNDPKTVNYNGIIGVLIEAIKELKKEVEDLKRG
jgi:hypothetical protein